jgi:peptide methionine sulfoxide reductase MsrA
VPAERRSGIYFHTEAQRKVAEVSLAAQTETLGGRVVTEIQKVSLRPRAVEQ